MEHDPEEIWASQLEVARLVLGKAGASADDIAAIGIANQRETTLLWDRESGRAIHPAIVWQDRRTADRCEELRSEGHELAVQSRTGLLLDSYFSATKLEWLLDRVAGVRDDAEAGRLAFGTIDSYLTWRLTGGREHVTDVTNASRTLLFDIHRREWSEELLKLFRIPVAVLPRLCGSTEVVGHTDPQWFGKPIPIAGIAGDQQAATFGQACFRAGMAKNTYGTGCFLLMHRGTEARPSANQLLTTIACSSKSTAAYALEGSVFVAGAAVQWLRDEVGLIGRAEEAESIAETTPDTSGVYVVPAFTGLGAPYWDPNARGAIVGLTRGSGRSQIVRATLESIAYQCRDVLKAMAQDCGAPLREIRVDGGAASNNFLMQFQADMLGIPVVRPKVTETTALGAAYLAGLAVGFWSSEDELESLWQTDRIFTPAMSEAQREGLYGGWLEAVGRVRSR